MGRPANLNSIYLVTFLYALHYAVTIYVESSFLSRYVEAGSIGLLFMAAAVVSLLVHFRFPQIVRSLGNYTLILILAVAEIASLVILATEPVREVVIFTFIAHQTILNLFFLSLNIFVESSSKDETTGGTRGIFLTVLNSAILIGPLITGQILGGNGYSVMFFVSALIMVPVFIVIASSLSKFRDPNYDHVYLVEGLRQVITRDNIRRIFATQFLLEFFYGIMVIYTPIYLSKTVGIPLHDVVGVIMPIALLPFIIFPYITGLIADHRIGEKEMLSVGFMIAGLATIFLPIIGTKNILVWALALFITRIGATLIETMAGTYFFKQIDATDTHLISLFGNLRSLSYIIAPLAASLVLIFADMKYLFIFLGLVMLSGLFVTAKLKDTR